ncbi:MAG: AIPR family protein [Pyrinomonadaceae bacterium]
MKYRIPVLPDHVRKLTDPNDNSIRIVHAFINVNDLPDDLPSDPDPRRPKDSGVVPKRISESLLSNDGKFHLLNRGITISAETYDFDNKNNVLVLQMPLDDARYGILDGGHTYWAIKKYKGDLQLDLERTVAGEIRKVDVLTDQFVHVEILENVDEHLADIAEARNFSVPLKSSTLAGYRKKFDWLIDALGPERAKKIIRQSENDDEPVPVLDVIQVLGAVNPVLFADERPARDAYTSAGKILGYFVDENDPYEFKKMRNIALDVLKLYDYIRLTFEDKYNAADDAGRRGRFGARVEAREMKEKRGAKMKARYYWIDDSRYIQGKSAIDKGFAIPLISGFRVLLEEEKGQFKWLSDPFRLFDKYGDKLVKAIMNASDNGNNEPWAVARDPQVYRQLTSEVRRWYLEGKFEAQGELI